VPRLLYFLICLLAGAPMAAAAPNLSFLVSPDPVAVGDTVTVDVEGTVSDLLTLVLNPEIDTLHLTLLTFQPGAGLPGASDPLNSFLDTTDPAHPSLLFSGTGPFTGAGAEIAQLTFTATEAGQASVDFSETPLAAPNPSCAPAPLASCYEHNTPGLDPTPLSGSVSFTISQGATSIPEPGTFTILLGLAGLAALRWARS
jgi:hypothetical protein